MRAAVEESDPAPRRRRPAADTSRRPPVNLGGVHVSVEDDDVEVLGVRGNRLWGFCSADGFHARAAEHWVVERDEDLLAAFRFRFIQPLLQFASSALRR